MSKRQINPKKLLLSKWTATCPVNKEKHFMVSKVIKPEPPEIAIEFIELEAVYSQRCKRVSWRVLQNVEVWLQGWV